jgi:hypothetical protein
MQFIYPYTVEYFNSIIDILEKGGEMSFNKLFKEWVNGLRKTNIQSIKHRKRRHSKPTKFTPSKTEFSKIIKRMLEYGYLRKEVNEKSKLTIKETSYVLTDNSRRLLQMNILKIDNEQLLFKRIYEEFFTLHDFFLSVLKKVTIGDPYSELYEKVPLSERIVKILTFSSEDDFNNFLIKQKLNPDSLEWGVVSYGESKSSIIANILYPYNISTRLLKEQKKRYCEMENQQRVSKENQLLICFPKIESPDDLDFWIRRIEEWNLEKKGTMNVVAGLISRKFILFIPGVSEEDIFSEDDSLEPADVHEA